MASIAINCEYEIGFSGAVGYKYESVKDNLRWSNLSRKRYTKFLMEVGRYMALDKKDFDKVALEHDTMTPKEIGDILIRAFGDGK